MGTPCKELAGDPKFQGELLNEQIHVGERVALTSLASELLILDVAGIPRRQQHKYTGRGQYPQFKLKPVLCESVSKASNGDLLFCAEVSGCFRAFCSMCASACVPGEIVMSFSRSGKELIQAALHRVSELSTDLQYEASTLPKFLPSDNPIVLDSVCNTINNVYRYLVNCASSKSSAQWDKYVEQQLASGGGKLFACIARWEKSFLKVHWESHAKGSLGPSEFLEGQVKEWMSYWYPDDAEFDDHELSLLFSLFRKYALEDEHTDISLSTFDKALFGYKKDTLGSDLWSSTELCQPLFAQTLSRTLIAPWQKWQLHTSGLYL